MIPIVVDFDVEQLWVYILYVNLVLNWVNTRITSSCALHIRLVARSPKGDGSV